MNLNDVLNKLSEWVFGPSMSTLSQKAEDPNLPLDQRVQALYKMVHKGSIKHAGDKELIIRAYTSLPQVKQSEIDNTVYDYATDVQDGAPCSSIYSHSPECRTNSPTFGNDQILHNPFIGCVEKALYFKSGLREQDRIAFENSLLGKIASAVAKCLGFR